MIPTKNKVANTQNETKPNKLPNELNININKRII